MITTERGEKAMANHWANIQAACNKWHGMQEDVLARPESGVNHERQMVWMLEAYRDDNDQAEFKFLHVFTRIEFCEKWKELRMALAKGKDYVPDAPVVGASDGRPIGNKKAKAARDSVPSAERLQASIEQCFVDAKIHAVMREEKTEVRWTAMMAKHAAKLDLLKTNVQAKKRNTNLAFLTGADTAAMDRDVRAWFMVERATILSQIAPPTPSSPIAAADQTPPASIAPPPSAATTPIMLDEDEDEAEESPATI